MKKDVWHYPPELPDYGELIIWVSNSPSYGDSYRCCAGRYHYERNNIKRDGSSITQWAKLKDVLPTNILNQWKLLEGKKVVHRTNKWAVVPQDNGDIIVNGVRFAKV